MPQRDRSHLVLLFVVLVLSGCRSTPVRPSSFTTVDQPVEVVHKAAVNALVSTGFDVERTEALYIEGYRPRRWGLVAGSGGETVAIWLEWESPSRTRMSIDTGQTFLGGAGQKNWNYEVFNAIHRELERKD